MGKGEAKAAEKGQLNVANTSRDLSGKLMGDSDEIRNSVGLPNLKIASNYYNRLASGNPEEIFRSIAPAVEQINAAGSQAKQNIDTTMPRGGEKLLAKDMVDINTAGQVGQAGTKAYEGAFPALASMGTTGTQLSLGEIANAVGALTGSGQMFGALGQQEAAGKAGQMGSAGQLAGNVAMAAGTAVCWIAEALYGEFTPETTVLRFWLNSVWSQESRLGAAVVWFYRKVGFRVARWVRRYRVCRWLLKPLFDYGLKRAQRELNTFILRGRA